MEYETKYQRLAREQAERQEARQEREEQRRKTKAKEARRQLAWWNADDNLDHDYSMND
jgi:hypothetical protein